MQRMIWILCAAFVVSACSAPEPVKETETIGKTAPVTPAQPASPASPSRPTTSQAPQKKTTLKEAVKSATKRNEQLNQAEEEEDTVRSPHTVTIYPMNTDNIRGTSEAYRSLNTPRSTPDYLQTKPRERDPFYDTVDRTGANPMNARDRTTNRRAFPY
jgi:hypothetical protein